MSGVGRGRVGRIIGMRFVVNLLKLSSIFLIGCAILQVHNIGSQSDESVPRENTVMAGATTPRQLTGLDPYNLTAITPLANQANISTGFIDPSGNLVTPTVSPQVPAGPSRAQTDPLLASLATIETILANKNQQTQDEYNRAIQGYDAQDALDLQAHDKNVFQNENSYTSNNQAALLNAANASTGLRGVLASLGALGGSGLNIVHKLVGLAANQDTGSARQNFTTNADAVNTAWAQADQQEKQRRADAQSTLQNNLQNNKANVLSSKQSIYQQLANVYGADNPQGVDYASKASALAPEIAATTRASVAPYAAPSALFTPAALQNYLAGTQNLNVSTSGGGSSTPLNSPIFGQRDKKDQLVGVA